MNKEKENTCSVCGQETSMIFNMMPLCPEHWREYMKKHEMKEK